VCSGSSCGEDENKHDHDWTRNSGNTTRTARVNLLFTLSFLKDEENALVVFKRKVKSSL
jgi:hypothetical protein